MNRIAARCLALSLAVGLPAAAAAHHGWAWTEERETRLTGTIQSISFGNPHMHLQVRAESGNVWEVDLSPPIVARRAELSDRCSKRIEPQKQGDPGGNVGDLGHCGSPFPRPSSSPL